MQTRNMNKAMAIATNFFETCCPFTRPDEEVGKYREIRLDYRARGIITLS